MSTVIEIVNLALTLLGENRIMALTDNSKPAREANAIYEITRDALLAGYNWSFAKSRAQLPASAIPPAFEWAYAYPLPSDCLRLLFVGDYYAGVDLTDYRGAPTAPYAVEGREILTDMGSPLNLRYIKRLTNTTMYSANFAKALGARLAADLSEPLTQSDTKRARAEDVFKKELSIAVRAGAIELPPERLADDDWIMGRL